MHKLKHGTGQLKFARLPLHVLLRFLAVICVLRVITIIEFGKIKSKIAMRTNNNLVDFAKISTKEYYPENIVYERTSWNGENAFIFGNLQKS